VHDGDRDWFNGKDICKSLEKGVHPEARTRFIEPSVVERYVKPMPLSNTMQLRMKLLLIPKIRLDLTFMLE
jgi:hypothetical protein